MSEIKQKREELLLLTLILKTTLISNSLDKTNEMLPENCSKMFLSGKKNQSDAVKVQLNELLYLPQWAQTNRHALFFYY